jgi:NitT/TauT family transport system ATP-binding protein
MRDTVTPAEAAIHLDQVSKVFGNVGTEAAYRAVDGLNLDVRPGQMLALLGKTGCGKSTIFNMVAGLTDQRRRARQRARSLRGVRLVSR